MSMAVDLSALGSLTATGSEPPQTLGEQMEYLFAQQLMHALSQHEGEGEGEGEGGQSGYLAMLSDALARDMARQGALGLAQQFRAEGEGPAAGSEGQP